MAATSIVYRSSQFIIWRTSQKDVLDYLLEIVGKIECDGFSLNSGKRQMKSLSSDFAIKSLSVRDKEIVRKIVNKRFPAGTTALPN